MSVKSLAVKYRPQTFNDVVEQDSIKIILQQQLNTDTVKNAYLFVGGAGTGKTTCARIFANKINKGQGNPIEMDAASNSGVDDVRNITEQAKLKSINSEYKVFIIDECHALSNSAWQAMLKIIEEPPAKSIFIFCTTDPQKIPKTILSRVQRYDFHRISQEGIVTRLNWILDNEIAIGRDVNDNELDSLEYIAKIADGGMRDAITMLDKCLSLSKDLTLKNVVKALGTVDHKIMIELTDAIIAQETHEIIFMVEKIHAAGKDIKLFVSQYLQFILDICKYGVGCDLGLLQIPALDENVQWLKTLNADDIRLCKRLLSVLMRLNTNIKYSQSAKYDLEITLFLFVEEPQE